MCAEHENVNYSLHFRAELIKIVMRAEHENVNCSLHFRAELKSGFQFNHGINNKLGFKHDQLMMHDEKTNTKL